MSGPVVALELSTSVKLLRQNRSTIMKIHDVPVPMSTAEIMTLGAFWAGLGISSIRCVAASKPVRPKVDCRRPRMNAIPSGH